MATAVGAVPNIGVIMSVELSALLRGLSGVTVCMVEDGFDKRSPEMPWAIRGGVTLPDLGDVVS